MESYKRHRLGGLNYQLNYYQGKREITRERQTAADTAKRLEANQKAVQQSIRAQTQALKTSTVSRIGGVAQTIGTAGLTFAAPRAGSKLFSKFSAKSKLKKLRKQQAEEEDADWDTSTEGAPRAGPEKPFDEGGEDFPGEVTNIEDVHELGLGRDEAPITEQRFEGAEDLEQEPDPTTGETLAGEGEGRQIEGYQTGEFAEGEEGTQFLPPEFTPGTGADLGELEGAPSVSGGGSTVAESTGTFQTASEGGAAASESGSVDSYGSFVRGFFERDPSDASSAITEGDLMPEGGTRTLSQTIRDIQTGGEQFTQEPLGRLERLYGTEGVTESDITRAPGFDPSQLSEVEAGARPGASDSTLARVLGGQRRQNIGGEEKTQEPDPDPSEPSEAAGSEPAPSGSETGASEAAEEGTAEAPRYNLDLGSTAEDQFTSAGASAAPTEEGAAAETVVGDVSEGIEGAADVAEGVDAAAAGLESAAAITDTIAAAAAPIPGLDIVMGLIAGITTAAGIGAQIYSAVKQGQDDKKAKAPDATAPTPNQKASQPNTGFNYVGASSDNYFDANQHFSSF